MSTTEHESRRQGPADAATIGLIGLGKMGGAMAARYLAAAYTVHGHARHRSAADHLVSLAARAPRSDHAR